MKQQAGFTLIELIMVIVILGILAATALPRFSDLSTEARVAKVRAMQGSMQSASLMAHSLQQAQGAASNVNATVEGGAPVTMANGYPTANAAGIGAAIDTSGYDITNIGTGVVAADAGHLNCRVTYNASVGGAAPVITPATAAADCS